MFLNYYGLREQPFGVTPDPRFLYLSPAHREALASLVLWHREWPRLPGADRHSGDGQDHSCCFTFSRNFELPRALRFFFRPSAIHASSCASSSGGTGGTVRTTMILSACTKSSTSACFKSKARAGNRFIVVIDEAQNLDPAVLETVRLLSDFETPRAKLMQIVLCRPTRTCGQAGQSAHGATPTTEFRWSADCSRSRSRRPTSTFSIACAWRDTAVSRFLVRRLYLESPSLQPAFPGISIACVSIQCPWAARSNKK